MKGRPQSWRVHGRYGGLGRVAVVTGGREVIRRVVGIRGIGGVVRCGVIRGVTAMIRCRVSMRVEGVKAKDGEKCHIREVIIKDVRRVLVRSWGCMLGGMGGEGG